MNDPSTSMGTLDWASVHDLVDTFSVAVLKCKLCVNFVTTRRDKMVVHISTRHTTFQAGMVVIRGDEHSQGPDVEDILVKLNDFCEIGLTSWCSGNGGDGGTGKTVSDSTLDIISEAALSAQVLGEIASVKEVVEYAEGGSTSQNADVACVGEPRPDTQSGSGEDGVEKRLSPDVEGLSLGNRSDLDNKVEHFDEEISEPIVQESVSKVSPVANLETSCSRTADHSDDDNSSEISVEQVASSSDEDVVEGSRRQEQENSRRPGLRTPRQRKRKVFQDCATEHNLEVGADGDAPYKCDKCDFTTDRARTMKGHDCAENDEMSKVLVVCVKCKATFSDKGSLLKHASNCSKTGLELKDAKGMSDDGVQDKDTEARKKLRRQRKRIPHSPQPCKLCGFLCKSESSLKIHMHKHKESRAPRTYSCDGCGKKYTTQMGVSRHKLSWCRGNKQKTHVSYMCAVCNKSFKNKMIYREHLTVHSAIRNHACDVCSKSFKTSRALHRHTTNKHTGVSYKCSLCEFQTSWKGSLKTHYVTKHDSESRPLHKCPECPFTTRSALYITRHVLTHRDERPFMCEHCGKSFKADTVLRAHLEMHDDTKQYPCDKCEYVGNSKGALYSHRASHITKELMQYRCRQCDWVGRRKSELQVHQRKHSAMKLFRCGHCGQSYKHKHGLTRHLKEKHMVQTSVMQTEVVFPDYEMEYSEDDPTLALSTIPVAQFFEISTEILADTN